MHSFITTSAVGGLDGHQFQDVHMRASDGSIVVDDLGKDPLDVAHPIQKIIVSHGWIVDGIAVTYQLANGDATTIGHGSQFANASVVELNATEVLVGVFGRAGWHEYYKREMVVDLGFVVFDAAQETTRIVGPFGNGDESNHGKPFYCSDVLAFGGFAVNTNHLGLSGLFFFKDAGMR
ncbi:uncharacterized protein TRAVEDRAFT_23706 [Trametes versicolor FP-101664 SS1]|uniref:uncharacterized protein n=1 Tax=Trametes versicolor (strain FP-101664) TaxID=717944 RepID=UPI0004621A6A|nr:uncharacterized protein TRAVEDRAFT_23706 [Trametes versicolor FP-101664 SS1]EIW53318.1 hypothetical protein TRAVEDRAFT_23706 [Trametes versicolor FP-101664 SS1]